MEIVGREVNNVKGGWYVEGGTFCSKDRLAFSFEETVEIYKRNLDNGSTFGIPRCLECGCSLRTRSKSSHESGFWDKIRIMKKNGEMN